MHTPRTPGDPGQVSSIIRLSPEVVAEGDRALDELDALLDPPKPPIGNEGDDEPPTSRTPVPPLSHLLERDDGAILLSLEDADDRDLSGREIIRCIVLLPEELDTARAEVDNAFAAAAATIIARLPRKP